MNFPTSEVDLFISCSDLIRKDLFSKSDGFFEFFVDNTPDAKEASWTKLFSSSTILNNNNPSWDSEPVNAQYFFESKQPVKIIVYDGNNVGGSKSFIGEAQFLMADVFGARQSTLIQKLQDKKGKEIKTSIKICGEIKTSPNYVRFQFGVKDLPKGLFSTPDPMFQICKLSAKTNKMTKAFESERVDNKRSCLWKEQTRSMQTIFGDEQNKVEIRVFDHEKNQKHKLIGKVETTLEQLLSQNEVSIVPVKSKKNFRASFIIKTLEIQERHSLVDFLSAGLQLNLMVAIDFTASNASDNLHAMSPEFAFTGSHTNLTQLNQYQKAIVSTGRVLLDYDSDKKVPVYGFGGYYSQNPPADFNLHCFPLNKNNDDAEVHDLDGIMEIYKQARGEIILSGGTRFSNVIKRSVTLAKESNQTYTVLLLLTDGQNQDMDETIDAIFDGADCPLSIVIVGIGSANFTNMEILDGDSDSEHGRLSRINQGHNEVLRRDLVQFVPFRDFQGQSIGSLAQEVLREIPTQLSDYYQSKQITPEDVRKIAAENPIAPEQEIIPVATVVSLEQDIKSADI